MKTISEIKSQTRKKFIERCALSIKGIFEKNKFRPLEVTSIKDNHMLAPFGGSVVDEALALMITNSALRKIGGVVEWTGK